MRPAAALGLLAALAAAGCAETRENASGSVLDAVTGTSFGPKPVTPAPFVSSSRPAENAPFMAVGVSAPARSVKPKTKEELAATEAAMTGAGARNQATGVSIEAEGKRVTSSAPKAPKVEE